MNQKLILLLIEELKSKPGNDAGYVDYEKIDGHHVHVIHKHLGKGSYSTSLQVNGRLSKNPAVPMSLRTSEKVFRFLASSMKTFEQRVRPNKINITANLPNKKELFTAWANKDPIRKIKITKNRIEIRYDSNSHVPSGQVKRTTKDPHFHYTKKSGKPNPYTVERHQKINQIIAGAAGAHTGLFGNFDAFKLTK